MTSLLIKSQIKQNMGYCDILQIDHRYNTLHIILVEARELYKYAHRIEHLLVQKKNLQIQFIIYLKASEQYIIIFVLIISQSIVLSPHSFTQNVSAFRLEFIFYNC